MPDKSNPKKTGRSQTKDRVLQARIPEQLDDELRDRAEQLGLSVSTIVRNVLLNTFELVEGVVTDSSQLARVFKGRSEPPSDSTSEPEVIAWQEAILNRNGVCEQCNAILPIGQRAALGVPAGHRATLLCMDCLATLSSTADEPALPETSGKKPPPAKKKSARSRKTPK